jgi:hypothetical protein
MVTGPDGQRLTVDDHLAEISKRYGPDSLIGRFIAKACPDLVGAAAHRHPLAVPRPARHPLVTDSRADMSGAACHHHRRLRGSTPVHPTAGPA